MILTLPPEEEEVEQQQLLATKDTNGKVTHVIVKDQEKQPVWTKLEKYLLPLCNDILLPKLFRPTVRKNCSSDLEKLSKFEAESREFANILRSLEQFIQTVESQNNFR